MRKRRRSWFLTMTRPKSAKKASDKAATNEAVDAGRYTYMRLSTASRKPRSVPEAQCQRRIVEEVEHEREQGGQGPTDDRCPQQDPLALAAVGVVEP
jgi:hypothetical protein